MIDYSLIKLIPADESHYEFSYEVKKAALGPYITQIWGWDEGIQKDFHAKRWQQERPDIIMYDGKSIGTISIIESEDCIEIRQLFILPEYQNQGIGSHLLKQILDQADQAGRITKLDYLKINPVESLYKRSGFQIVGANETQYFMERKPSGGAKVRGV
jgi:GNAT superfamily N-acetyltransferase